MQLATAYYPDYYRPDQWEEDYRLIREAGISCIRIGEFAWTAMEPEDGLYDWGWLDRSIELAVRHGLQVILCTPTACPPIWLIDKHPGILPVGRHGRTIGFGARQHRSYSSEEYIAHSLRIVERMAERYGRHAGIVAWQIDNEFGGETKYDYSEAAQRRFQRYLERKFGSIEELNERWGTAFWSQTYRSFEQIPLPVPYDADVMMWPHPSLELEFERFCSRAMADFNALQMETIRRYSNAPLTTNAFMFNWGDNVNWADLFRGSDAVGIDIYSEDPVEIAFYADACRSLLNRPFWVMEYGTSSKTLASEMDLLVGRGCERFSLFKFRLFPWGQEQEAARSALLDVTRHPRPSYFEVQRWATEARAERSPEPLPPSGCGIYYDFDCSWAYRISMHDRKKYFDVIFRDVYASFHMQDRTLQVAFRPEDIEGLKLLALPLQIMHDEALEAALIRFVESGGILIATSDLFRKNRDNVFLDKVPMLFRTLLGWTDSRFVDDVPELAESKEIVLLHGRYGKGRMWLVRRDLDKADWQRLAVEARETLAD